MKAIVTHKARIAGAAIAAACALLLHTTVAGCSGCQRKLGMTQIAVQDSVRHYFPIPQGSELQLTWRVANVGSEPLVLTDIQPSCGCIVADPEESYVIPAGKERVLTFTFNSDRNSGYVNHTIRLFGNIAPEGMASLVFDTNVIPPSGNVPDYEEQFIENNRYDVLSGIKTVFEDSAGQRGYWINEGEYPGGYRKYPWWEKP